MQLKIKLENMKSKIQLNNIIALAIILFNTYNVKAQQQYEVKSEKDLANVFQIEKAKYEDTLSNNIKQGGIVFVKFQINSQGRLDSINFSEKHPKVLLFVITKILNNLRIVDNSTERNKIYVLPIEYNYLPELKLPLTSEQLLNQVPKIDVTDLTSYMNFDFNGLFNVPESQKGLWGRQCVFLPMIKIARPIVFDKDNRWPTKSN